MKRTTLIGLVGIALWVVNMLPPVRALIETTMTSQMLVQLTMLTMSGWFVAHLVPLHVRDHIDRWNAQGIAGLLLATVTSMVWMLPRMMDSSLSDGTITVAKFVTVPLLIGVPLALSWPLMGFVVRGFFLLEAVATAFRLGWLYLISPERVCVNYLIDDQQVLGIVMLCIGGVLFVYFGWKLMFSTIRT